MDLVGEARLCWGVDAEMKEYLDEMVAAMHAGFSRMEKRFDAVEERLGSIEERLDAVEQRLDALEERAGAVEDRVGALELRVEERFISVTTSPGTCGSGSAS